MSTSNVTLISCAFGSGSFPILEIASGATLLRTDGTETLYPITFFAFEKYVCDANYAKGKKENRSYCVYRTIRLLMLSTLKLRGILRENPLYTEFCTLVGSKNSPSALSSSFKEEYQRFFDEYEDYDGIISTMNHNSSPDYEIILKEPETCLELISESPSNLKSKSIGLSDQGSFFTIYHSFPESWVKFIEKIECPMLCTVPSYTQLKRVLGLAKNTERDTDGEISRDDFIKMYFMGAQDLQFFSHISIFFYPNVRYSKVD